MAWLLRLCGLLRGRSGKAIVLVLMMVSGGVVWAACDEWQPVDYRQLGWHLTPESACKAIITYTSASAPAGSPSLVFDGMDGDVCLMWRGDPSNKYRMGLDRRSRPDCNTCEASKDQPQIINATAAWQRTPSTAPNQDWLYPTRWTYGGMNKVCGPDKCEVAFDPLEPCPDCGSYVSQVPAANGMYRVSIDMLARGTGSQCSPSDKDNPVTPNDAKDPPCPGFVGEVNGVRGCYGTADKPIRPEAPSGPANSPERGAGNPAAGKKPETGEGSGTGGAGRTPSQGSGGSQGGPASSAGGKKPDGTTTKPGDGKEQAACGAPGQAKCKIDETGTPDGKGAFDGPTKSLDEAFGTAKKQLDGVNAAGDKDTGWGVVPSWMQHSACTPWSLGTLPVGDGREITVDVCRIMPYVETVTSFLWAITTFIATLAMVFRVTTASKGA